MSTVIVPGFKVRFKDGSVMEFEVRANWGALELHRKGFNKCGDIEDTSENEILRVATDWATANPAIEVL